MISRKEMMLNPRQRPKSPPREAMKSTGPILMPLSNSGKIGKFFLTFLPMTVSLPKKMLTTAMSSSQALYTSWLKLTLTVWDSVRREKQKKFKSHRSCRLLIRFPLSPLTWWWSNCPCASSSWGCSAMRRRKEWGPGYWSRSRPPAMEQSFSDFFGAFWPLGTNTLEGFLSQMCKGGSGWDCGSRRAWKSFIFRIYYTFWPFDLRKRM